MMAIRHSDVREAIKLDAMPRRLAREYSKPTSVSERVIGAIVVHAFQWLGPMVLPLLALLDAHPIILGILAIFFVFLPVTIRRSLRNTRSDVMHLYGPPADSVIVARMVRHAPWLCWSAACLAAVPVVWLVARELALWPQAAVLGAVFFVSPIVYYADAPRPARFERGLRSLCVVAALVIGVRIARGSADPMGPILGLGPWVLESVLAALFLLGALVFCLVNLSRTLSDGSSLDGRAPSRPSEDFVGEAVEFAPPSLHRPARSARESERLLARLQLEHAWRRSPSPLARVLAGLAFVFMSLAPMGIALFCMRILEHRLSVVIRSFEYADGRVVQYMGFEAATALLAFWIATLFLAVSGERSGAIWLRGWDWREQLAAHRSRWLVSCLLPAFCGVFIGLLMAKFETWALLAGALVLSGCVFREGCDGLEARLPKKLFTLLCLAFLLLGPICYFADLRLSPRSAVIVSASALTVGILGIFAYGRYATEERLGDLWRSEMESEEDLEEDFGA